MTRMPPLVLCFAATDPTGGAGLQADILTLASLGCHPLTVVTAITVQDTIGVANIIPCKSSAVENQAMAVLHDIPVQAFKLGVLGSVDNIEVIAQILHQYPDTPLIIDPILASGRGDPLCTEEMCAAITTQLFPRATLVTPNIQEAQRLANKPDAPGDICARFLLDHGCRAVLITGTHQPGPTVINTLYTADGQAACHEWPRLDGHYHGSGCTLAAAIAGYLAQGLDISQANEAAQRYTWQTLQAGFRLGRGQSIPDRFFRAPLA